MINVSRRILFIMALLSISACSNHYDEMATREIVGTYRFSFANTYTQYNHQQDAVLTEWSEENDYSIEIDSRGVLYAYKSDNLLFKGLIDGISAYGESRTVFFNKKDISLTLSIFNDRLTIADFPFDCIPGGGSTYCNYFYRVESDDCIDCSQSDALAGAYTGDMIVTNYYNDTIQMYSDTITVTQENSTMSCKIRLVGIFDGLYHLNSMLYLVENVPGESVYFKGDTVFYGKYYYGTGNNWRHSFKGVKQL